MFEFAAGVPAVEVGVDPGLARLLLGERAGPVSRADQLEERATVGPAQVIALSPTAVCEGLVQVAGASGLVTGRIMKQ